MVEKRVFVLLAFLRYNWNCSTDIHVPSAFILVKITYTKKVVSPPTNHFGYYIKSRFWLWLPLYAKRG